VNTAGAGGRASCRRTSEGTRTPITALLLCRSSYLLLKKGG
jgi:hypothetical protein